MSIMNNRFARSKRAIIAGFLCACMTVSMAACGGETAAETETEVIELLEPVVSGAHYEEAKRRNLSEINVYSALVCPQVQEYELETSNLQFEAYDVSPGQQIKQGGTILHANTEALDERIKNMKKSILEAEANHADYLKDAKEQLEETEKNMDLYQQMIDKADAAQEPDETVTVTDPDTGEVTQEPNPEYQIWHSQYDQLVNTHRIYYISAEKQKEAIRHNCELYELDLKYQKTQLKRLQQDRQTQTLISGMSGKLGAVKYLDKGDRMDVNKPMAAVIDENDISVRCAFIPKLAVATAQDVYALINGKRYEVEYQPMESEERSKMEERYGKAYSTFTLHDPDNEVAVGDYAVIVVVRQTRENVLTVRRDSVKSESLEYYVYLVDGTKTIYTPVKIGSNDGVYIEITSGLEEGAHVLTEKASSILGTKTKKVEYGKISYNLKTDGYLYYPISEWVKNPVKYGTCYFAEKMVNIYQQVKKGDVLATIKVVPDKIALEQNEQKLAREKERLQDLIDAQKENEYEKQIELKKQNIEDLEELIKDMKKDYATKEIVAPMDGIITNAIDAEEGSLLWSDTKMFQISDESQSYIVVGDENGQLSYGNQAAITYKDATGLEYQATGQVVTLNDMEVSRDLAADNKLYMPGSNGGWWSEQRGALIMVDPEYAGELAGSNRNSEGWWSRVKYTVSVEIKSMDHVLLVPKKAVTDEKGSTYVYVKLDNGDIEYRKITVGGSDNTNYWIVDGLTEGMEICLE